MWLYGCNATNSWWLCWSVKTDYMHRVSHKERDLFLIDRNSGRLYVQHNQGQTICDREAEQSAVKPVNRCHQQHSHLIEYSQGINSKILLNGTWVLSWPKCVVKRHHWRCCDVKRGHLWVGCREKTTYIEYVQYTYRLYTNNHVCCLLGRCFCNAQILRSRL